MSLAIDGQKFVAIGEILRALELTLQLSSGELTGRVRTTLQGWLEAHLSELQDFIVPLTLIGTAHLDKKRVVLDYTGVAQKLEDLAAQGIGRKSEGSIYAVAFEAACLTKDQVRIERVGRIHVAAFLARVRSSRCEFS